MVSNKMLGDLLHKLGDEAYKGNCNMTVEEAADIFEALTDHPVSIEKACEMLNVSRSRFYELIKEGVIPRGRKNATLKSVVWRSRDVLHAVKTRRKKI